MSDRTEYIHQLRVREKQLLSDLEAIRKLLASEGVLEHNEIGSKAKENKISIIKSEGVPKGKLGWEEYCQTILKELGGRAKSQKVIEYAIKANPRIKPERITDAIRGKISKLGKLGIIGVEKGASKTEGYEYFILKKEDKPKPPKPTFNLQSILKQA